MTFGDFDWRSTLQQLFAATVNQQTLEEAAELMVSVSASDENYHKECLHVFDEAITAAKNDDISIKGFINKSGYQVENLADAIELLQEFRTVYLDEYQRITAN